MNNPLIGIKGLPAFDVISAEHVASALDALLADCYVALEQAAGPGVPADYDALSRALDVQVERLNAAWGAVSHLHAVADTPDLRKAHQDCLPRVTSFCTALRGDDRLYRKYKALAVDASLTPARARMVANSVRDCRLSGAELEGAAKERFGALQQRHAALSQNFANNVLDATDRYARFASAHELRGLPPDVLALARAAAEKEGRDGYKLGLNMSTYLAVMRQADERALRAEFYRAYTTRASDLGPAELDNTPVMRELLALRQELARLLGKDNYAELSLVPKMADTPAQVSGFLADLARRARTQAQHDVDELTEFARTQLNLPQLEAWDITYASEKLRQARYAFSQQEVKAYFTIERVLDGLFRIVRELFDVELIPVTAPVWHDSVRVYQLRRDGKMLGQFYLDLYSRPGKRAGAWVNGAVSRWRQPGGSLRVPYSHVVCNFTPPDENGQALLGHEEVVTLFHEFGHNLHFLLSTVDDLGVSGFDGVEWDAVELPSQLMENFCWQWEVLESLSAHAQTREALPRALFDRMREAKNFQAGLGMLRQIEFALLDMGLHTEPGSEADVMGVLDAVRKQVALLPSPEFNRFPHAFSHIFAGGYAAGYYSYLWAELLSADAWSVFEEAGTFDLPAWTRYRQSILEVGGSRPMAESFHAFRGRAPEIGALLRQRGLDVDEPQAA